MGMTNAAHFSKRLRPIRYKVNYKSRNNDVERVIRERQLLRVRNPKIHSLRDWFVARDFDLRLRRVNRDHCGGRARTYYKVGKDSGATTDIEPARMSGRCEPIEKDRTHGKGPAAHELLIGSAVAKMLLVLGHFAPPSPRLNWALSKVVSPQQVGAQIPREPSLPPNVLGERRGLPRPSQPNWLAINFHSLSHSRQRRSTTSFTDGMSRISPQLMPAGRHIASGSPVMSARGETNW